jgi:hypothetical protein
MLACLLLFSRDHDIADSLCYIEVKCITNLFWSTSNLLFIKLTFLFVPDQIPKMQWNYQNYKRKAALLIKTSIF